MRCRYGSIIELVVTRDKASGQSKGSAFVWFQTRAMAEDAMDNLNNKHVLHDPSGAQDRPLVVRRANLRNPNAGGSHAHAHGHGTVGAMQASAVTAYNALSHTNWLTVHQDRRCA